MVFTVERDGQLKFKETAVQDPMQGGELRAPDRIFAQVFSRNIISQQFAEAAKVQFDIQAQQHQSENKSEETAQLGPVASQSSLPTLKSLADRVREADLEVVADNLGLERDRHDKHKWRDAEHIISINNGKFMDWLADQGGGGAIDLVMHLQKVDFKQAVQWLSGQDLTVRPVHSPPQTRSTRDEHQPLQMPVVNEYRWAAVKDYLIETRKLPKTLKQLWQWHQVAQALGKSGNYLNRITEVARDFNRGVPLSEQAQRAMQKDFQQSQLLSKSQQRETIFPLVNPQVEIAVLKKCSSPYSMETELD